MSPDNIDLDAQTRENDEKAKIARLATLNPLQYDRQRAGAAEELGVTVSASRQQRAGRDHAADAVVHRQAAVHAVARARIHQAGEPEAPLAEACPLNCASSRGAEGRPIHKGDVAFRHPGHPHPTTGK
jgi:hypothetical protein